MPTIAQLPAAATAGDQDEIPLSQGGVTRSVTVGELMAGTQPAITIPSGTLLGRVSLGPGSPEPINVGTGLALVTGALDATGGDHAGFARRSALTLTDDTVINASGTPMLLALPLLRGLFAGGTNVAISSGGTISATTDPSVTGSLSSLSGSLASTQAQVTTLSGLIPTGAYVALNAQGQMIDPVAADVTLGTVLTPGGSAARSLGNRAADRLNVLDFGATAGGADCGPGFLAAFAALPASGGEIFVPAGDYVINESLALAGKPIALRGAGKGATRLHFAHNGIGFDISPGVVTNKVTLQDLSGYAESLTGPTAAVAHITFPSTPSFGYVSAIVDNVECFGYPVTASGVAPFPQSFGRGLVLNGCWSAQVNNMSFCGPPAAPGTSSAAAIELNQCIDTRITSLQLYGGNAGVLQTGYCEGIYLINPLAVGPDYLVKQTDETGWAGYMPNKAMLLGLWIVGGEVNTNLGTLQLDNVSDGFVSAVDITRDGGPNTGQTLFDLTNVSNFYIVGCNFIGGPSGGNNQDTAFGFKSTWDSSSNVIVGCHFEDMATVINIAAPNGTVGLTTSALHLGNVPIATAIIDNTAQEIGNCVDFITPAAIGIPAGIGKTQDHLFAATKGETLFRITSVAGAANYLRPLAATPHNSPTLCFDGTDSIVNAVLQSKSGNFYFNAAGGTGGTGNMLSLVNSSGAVAWVQVQNATAGNLCQSGMNSGGLSMQPKGSLWLSPGAGLFASGLPTSRPTVGSGQIWNNGGTLSMA